MKLVSISVFTVSAAAQLTVGNERRAVASAFVLDDSVTIRADWLQFRAIHAQAPVLNCSVK